MRSQGLEAAQPRRKDPAPPSRPPGPGLAPRPGPAGLPPPTGRESRWVGDITYIRTWEGIVYLATVPGCCTKKAVEYAIGATARGADSVVRGDRYGGAQVPAHDRRDGIPLGPGVPVHLRAARRPPGELRHSPFGGQDRGVLGGCLGGSRRMRPSRNERVYQMVYPTRSKAIRDIASQVELEHTIRNDFIPPWGTGRRARSARSTEQ